MTRKPTRSTTRNHGVPTNYIPKRHSIKHVEGLVKVSTSEQPFQENVPGSGVLIRNILKRLQGIVNMAKFSIKIDTTITQICIGIKTQFEEVGVDGLEKVSGFIR